MKKIITYVAIALATSASAEDSPVQEDPGLMQRGAEMFMQGLMQQLDPALEDFRALAEQFGPQMQAFMLKMGPKLDELAQKIDDIRHYEAPELLPNGDIIIRRRPDAPKIAPPSEAIEL